MKPINPMNERRRITRCQIVARVLLCLAAAAGAAIGCGWNGSTSHSVRFHAYQGEREMGRLPPLPTLANGMNNLRVSWESEDLDRRTGDDCSLEEQHTKEVDGLWERAEVAEKEGNLHLDRELLNEYLKRTEIARPVWFEPSDRQRRRNSAIDRLNALAALDRGSKGSRVSAYLQARHLYDTDKPVSDEINNALALVPSDVNLNDNITYLRSAELYRLDDFEAAGQAFRALARQYPGSEKREAALFIAAVATMKNSATYIPASGNSDYADSRPDNSVADQEWRDAFTGFQKVMKEYPRGHYFDEARGWLAYLNLRNRDRAGALIEYYRLLAARHENTRIEAAFSLQLIRSSATDDEISRVEKQLANEPEAALAFAYHNIYNYSIDPGESYPPYDPVQIRDSSGQINHEAEQRRDEEREKEWKQARKATSLKELIRILNFSKQLMKNYPGLAIGGAFALRAAQASEELEDKPCRGSVRASRNAGRSRQ